MKAVKRWLLALALAGAVGKAVPASPVRHFPFVGCPSDGQQGPQPAPAHGRAPIDPHGDGRFAYYSSSEGGVLAPRGWHCVELAGSNGITLIVTPDPHSADSFFGPGDGQLSGDGVVLSVRNGGTSGRWAVAAMIARHFPEYRSFLRDQFRIVDLGEMPDGPYPDDVVRRTDGSSLEFVTPKDRLGLGTDGVLAPGDPVRGLVMLFPEDDMTMMELDLRLSNASAADIELIMITARRERGR